MPTMILAILGGLIYGSFLNVLLYRLPEGQGINGRSHCQACQKVIAWYDLVPVVSFLLLRRRCRHCGALISWRYPVVEASTALVLGIFFAQQPILDLGALLNTVGLLLLISLFFFDLFYLILPDVFTWTGIIIFAATDFLHPQPALFLMSALLMAAFFAILYAVSRGRQLGFGDVKLALLIGLMLGYPLGFLAVVGGIWLGALIGLFLLIIGKATRKTAVPLGAFLCIASIVSIIFSHAILIYTARFFF